ncbi:GntR family transcriptional regulator [Hoeflea poritis]|uniref:GntR family transcriptional regulator n=1 Tax=Hoeflea poritis TaxID=2993659 RepID=A0ABT4VQQ2_9HYPH|nr:GntR family transcriptional regulator [Hoeflea poritis]MDA4847033.1 GntR family transcriptional regulator [Hoeflea poritis]
MSALLEPGRARGQQSQAQIIHDVLMGRLQRGEIGPEDRLVDTSVAAEFGVSRMPARDALMRLSHGGYLEATTRGFVLPRVTHTEILEIFDLRRLVEPRAVSLVAQTIDSGQLAELEETVIAARKAMQSGNSELMFKASERFRNGWIAVIPNHSLRKVIQRYMTPIQVVRMMTFDDRVNHPLIVDGNTNLYTAFARRDAVAAADTILSFIHKGETAYLKAVSAERSQPQQPAKSA